MDLARTNLRFLSPAKLHVEHIDRLLGEINNLAQESSADPGYGLGKGGGKAAQAAKPTKKPEPKKPAAPGKKK